MNPQELIYQENTSSKNEGIKHKQSLIEDSSSILQCNSENAKLGKAEYKSKSLSKRKHLLKNKLKDCSVVLCKSDIEFLYSENNSEISPPSKRKLILNSCKTGIHDFHSDIQKDAFHRPSEFIEHPKISFQKLKSPSEEIMKRCDTNDKLLRINSISKVPVEIFYRGVSKKPRNHELKQFVKPKVNTKEQRQITYIPNDQEKVEHKGETIKEKSGERNERKNNNFYNPELDPIQLDEGDTMEIKCMVRTYFNTCSSDLECCNACRSFLGEENVQNIKKAAATCEAFETETNNITTKRFSTREREEDQIKILGSSDSGNSSESDDVENSHNNSLRNAFKLSNDENSIRHIKCCECNRRFSTTLEVSTHLKKSGCYRKPKTKVVQKPTSNKLQDIRNEIATKHSTLTSGRSSAEEGDSGFSSPVAFSGEGTVELTTAFCTLDSISPAFHSKNDFSSSFDDNFGPFHITNDNTSTFHGGICPSFHSISGISPTLHKVDSTRSLFHTTESKSPTLPTTDSARSVIPAGVPAYISTSSTSPGFCATNNFVPISDVGLNSNTRSTASSEIPQDISELLFSCDMTPDTQVLSLNTPSSSLVDQFSDKTSSQDYHDNFTESSLVLHPPSNSSRPSRSPGSPTQLEYSTNILRSNSLQLSSTSRSTTSEESKTSCNSSPKTLPGTLLGNISQILSQNGVPKLSSSTQLKHHPSKSTITLASSSQLTSRSDNHTYSHMFGLPVSRWHIGTLCCPSSLYSTILQHMNAHRKHQIKKYRCIGCNLKTSDYTKFLNHIKQKIHHSKNPNHECGEERCRLIFPSQASKEIHRKECHKKLSSYCKACGTQVVTKEGECVFKVLSVPSIGEHALKVHGELWL